MKRRVINEDENALIKEIKEMGKAAE